MRFPHLSKLIYTLLVCLFMLWPWMMAGAAKTDHPIVVVIDPGHGGKDPGATGIGGHHEKDIVLSLGKILSAELNERAGYRAKLTRDADIFIPLRQRLSIAHRYHADLFIALHADTYKNGLAHGASVFALSEKGATSEMARSLADQDNHSEYFGHMLIPKDRLIRSVLIDLAQTHSIGVSLLVGQSILHRLMPLTGLHEAKVEQAAFVVLKSPDIPSLLIEVGYLSNSAQEKQLLDPRYQHQIASAIVAGVVDYFKQHPNV